MKTLLQGMRRAWAGLTLAHYRRQQRRLTLDEQRYEDRQSRHDAGIYERPFGD